MRVKEKLVSKELTAEYVLLMEELQEFQKNVFVNAHENVFVKDLKRSFNKSSTDSRNFWFRNAPKGDFLASIKKTLRSLELLRTYSALENYQKHKVETMKNRLIGIQMMAQLGGTE